jgi:hypothetical protein
MSTKLVSVVEDGIDQRGPDGKQVPRLGPDGKPIRFQKLVLRAGQLHRNLNESLADYGERVEATLDEIDEFYLDWNGRDDVTGIEGFSDYGMDLVSRTMATPEKVSFKESNRFACLSWMMSTAPKGPFAKRWSDAGNSGGKKAADKELDRIIEENRASIPNLKSAE